MRPLFRVLVGLSLAVNLLVAAFVFLPQSFTAASPSAQPTEQYFPQTQHWVRGKFLAYFLSHGGVAQQGYPLTEEFQEQNKLNNITYTVQYFERAIFELHPENAGTPYEVLLSQLGKFELDNRYPNHTNPAAAPQQGPSGTPVPPAPTAAPPPPATQPPAPVDDQAFVNYLAATYNKIGSHTVTWQEVHYDLPDITNQLTGPVVFFDVGTDQARILIRQTPDSDKIAWGRAILRELKTHWPQQEVDGELYWTYYTSSYTPSAGCHYVGDLSDQGWYNIDTIAEATYSPARGDSVTTCLH